MPTLNSPAQFSCVPRGRQVASVDGPLTNDTITMTDDDLGRMTARLINGYGISSLGYDALGRLTEEINELGTFTYGYAGVTSRLASVTYPNGQTSTYSYFGNSGDRRLQTIHHQTSAPATLSKFDYTYSVDGNILTWRQQAGTDAVMWEYGYDAAEQLTRAVKKSTDPTPSILKRYAYAYDPAGNRTIEQIDDAVIGASHNNLNRLTSQQPNGVIRVTGTVNEAATVSIQGQPASVSSAGVFDGTAAIPSGTSTFTVSAADTNNNVASKTYEIENTGSSKTFTYDANGNMTSDGTRTFEWDAENRLVALIDGSHTSEFIYDGLHRRVRIVERENSIVATEQTFVWVGNDIAEARSASGATIAWRIFRHGVEQNSSDFYFSRDHLMSIREVTDSSGGVRDRYEYDPFCKTSTIAGNDPEVLAFTGVLVHEASDLLLMKRRAYDTQLARWLSEDPLGMQDGPNLYGYVVNQPLRWIDPDGTALFKPMVPNGNISPNFTPQNFRPICDVPGFFGWEEKSCVTECCKAHDTCFDQNRCNWTSWLTIAYESACKRCNVTAASCVALAVPRGNNECLPCDRRRR